LALRIVFFGTPEFAARSLDELKMHFDVPLVVAQPDRPRGRGRALAAPPVKEKAFALGIPCLQVERPNAPGAIAALQKVEADLFVVVAYGAILSKELLAVPKLGAINLHASLLPAFRGASPIQAAILAGLENTGVTTMLMDEGLDTGDILLQREVPIAPEETAGELSARLAEEGATLLPASVDEVANGSPNRRPQDHARATLTKKIRKADGRLDFVQSAKAVHDRARAMTPWPGAMAAFDGGLVRFERTRVAAGTDAAAEPGAILGEGDHGGLVVACGTGAIEVLRVRPAGRNDMDARDWWRGLRSGKGSAPRFTTPSLDQETP
jgi:methionyl-tRNA formyltransferase